MVKSKITIRDIALCGLFTALIIAGAYINIPIPYLPITLQTFFTAMAGIILGSKKGAFSVIVYVLLGLVGLPIFAKGGGGVGYVLTPTFGFLIGFIAGTFLTGLIIEKAKNKGFFNCLIACAAGYGVIYAIGMPYYYLLTNFYIGTARSVSWVLYYCFLTTLPGDIIKCFLVALIGARLLPILNNHK